MMRFFTVFTFILLLSTNSFSSDHYKNAEASKRVNGADELWFKTDVATPSYIRFHQDFKLSENDVFGWLKDEFKLPSNLNFKLDKSTLTDDQVKHAVYSMTFNDVSFEFLRLTIHSKGGIVIAISGNIIDQEPSMNVQLISKKNAISSALKEVGSQAYKWNIVNEELWLQDATGDKSATFYPKPELVIISNSADYKMLDWRYAYKMNIYSHNPSSSEDIYIDAERGEVLLRLNAVQEVDSTGYANTVFSNGREITTDYVGNEFFLRESGRGNGIHTWNLKNSTNISSAVDFIDANDDNNWQFVTGDLNAYATDAHWGVEMAYDYLSSTFGINSIDDNGFALNSYIHFDEAFNGSRWDKQLKIMLFGDGPNNLIPLTTVDIVGHEVGHGLTQFTADLINQGESGALNESFSDILGNSIEYYGKPGSSSWRIGEDRGSFLRDMSFPNAKNDPDTYKGDFWYTGTNDNGGVHTNSGVMNHWFFLLSEGGNGINDNDYSYNMSGIGIINAALISYRTLSVYLSPTSDYEEVSYFSTIAAKDIFGNCSPQHEATVKAWNAVGIMNEYIDHTVAAFNTDLVDYCNLPFTINFNNESVNGESYVWDFGDETSSTESNPSHIYSKPGEFTVKLTVDGDGCGIDENIKSGLITASLVELPDVSPVTIYKGERAMLNANVMEGKVYWYSDGLSTNQLAQGNTFQTPKLATNTTYYVQSVVKGLEHEIGVDIANIGGDYSNMGVGVEFSTFQDVELHAITVKSLKAGTVSFSIKDDNGVGIFEKSIDLVVGVQKVVLDAQIPLGSNYVLEYSGAANDLWMADQASYPYEVSGLFSITRNTLDIEDAFPYFFNWRVVEMDCKSDVNNVLVSVKEFGEDPKDLAYVFYRYGFEYSVKLLFEFDTKVHFGLFSINGQMITDVEKNFKGLDEQIIPLNSLLEIESQSSGIYFITINGGEISETEKIVNKGGSN